MRTLTVFIAALLCSRVAALSTPATHTSSTPAHKPTWRTTVRSTLYRPKRGKDETPSFTQGTTIAKQLVREFRAESSGSPEAHPSLRHFNFAENVVQYVDDACKRQQPVQVREVNIICTAIINIHGRRGTAEEACRLVQKMEDAGVELDQQTYTAGVFACKDGRHWQLALNLLKRMHSKEFDSIIATNTAIAACASAGRSEEALAVLREVQLQGFQCDTVTYNTVIGACASSGEWRVACNLLSEMQRHKVPRDWISFSGVISACVNSGQMGVALEMFQMAIEQGVWQPIKFDPSSRSLQVDLHGFSVPVAQVALSHVFRRALPIACEAAAPVAQLVVITGYGKHSVNCQPAIKPAVQQLIQEQLSLPSLECAPGNPGCWVIDDYDFSSYRQ